MMAILFDRTSAQGRVELSDRDRLDLLHRMSTNDLSTFQPGEGRSTVLTTALARIIDRVIVYPRGETALMLTNYTRTVRQWLQRHIFWQDKVKTRDCSAELGQLELYGEGASAIVDRLAPGAAALALHHFLDLGEILVARTFPLDGDGFIIIAPPATLETHKAMLLEHASLGDTTRYERLRIEAGLPGPNHELTEEYIPLEAALWDSVSFQKGCYVGQEIIARMESRNKLAKTQVKVELDGYIDPGAHILSGEDRVGTLTSAIHRENGSAVGLGFVKPDRADPGTELFIESADGSLRFGAHVVEAPLIRARAE